MQKSAGFAVLAAMVLLAGSAHALNVESEEPYWTPDAATIARLEAGLKIERWPGENQATYPLAQYDRYYAGVTVRGQRRVRGKLILPPNREDNPKTGIHITDVKYLPNLRGGGCANVSVTYVVDRDLSSAQCDFTDAGAPESQQPHWIPDEQTVAHMEAMMRDSLKRTHPKVPDLSTYGRYYWGVTIEGSQVILGRVLVLPEHETGVHLASDWDNGPIILDGRCDNIHVAYDVKASTFTQLACDGESGTPPP